MNLVFAVIILFSTLMLLIVDPSLVLPALGDSSARAVDLTLKMLAIYAVWLGILKLCEVTGASDKLARLLRPVIRFLYGEIPAEAARQLSVNMAANVLGMGNAATPAAMKAVRAMDGGKKVADYAMIMLVVVNSTSLQLLPTTVIQLRQSFQSASASDIILPSLVASAASTLFGVALVFLLYRRECRKAPKKQVKAEKKIIFERKKTGTSSKAPYISGTPSIAPLPTGAEQKSRGKIGRSEGMYGRDRKDSSGAPKKERAGGGRIGAVSPVPLSPSRPEPDRKAG